MARHSPSLPTIGAGIGVQRTPCPIEKKPTARPTLPCGGGAPTVWLGLDADSGQGARGWDGLQVVTASTIRSQRMPARPHRSRTREASLATNR